MVSYMTPAALKSRQDKTLNYSTKNENLVNKMLKKGGNFTRQTFTFFASFLSHNYLADKSILHTE